MASINLQGDTSGAITISAPSVAGTNTLTLPATTQTLATQNALGVRNLIINGDMRIDQRNAGSAVAMAVAYTLDRWLGVESTDGGCNVQQVTDAPANATHSLKVTVTTADASLAAAQYTVVRQILEGNNIAHLGWGTSDAKTITISFWVKSSVTGTYAVTVNNSAYNRGYVATYTISSANTWEYKTVTITGDTTGAWNTDNTSGIVLNFGLGTGTDHQNTADSWVAGYGFGTASTTNLMATNSATWQVSLVQLEVGDTATPFEHRPYDMELARCQRYYYHLTDDTSSQHVGTGYWGTTVSARGAVHFPVPMRTSPSMSYSSGSHFKALIPGVSFVISTAITIYKNSEESSLLALTVSGGTTGQGTHLEFYSSPATTTYLGFSAEL